MPIESVMPSNCLILCYPFFLWPSVFLSIRVFSSESVLRIRCPKYWTFSFSISPSNEYSGWFPLGLTCLMSLHSKGLSRVFSSTTVWRHQFFGTQPFLLSNSDIHTLLLKKIIVLTIHAFVGKVMSVLFNTLSRFVITFLPKSKHLLISWLQSPFTVFWSPRRYSLSLLPVFPHLFAMKWWHDLSFKYDQPF